MTTRFGVQSTADDVLDGIDLSGKRVLVTGVSAGLGVETARAAAAHGASVIGTARDLAKAGKAMAPHSQLGIEVLECDLASLASVRACADILVARGEAFDVVIANAGVMNCPFGRTEDGFETQFGTNFLGHFMLLNRIAPLVRPGGRIVILSSSAHQPSDVDLDDPGFEKTSYVPLVAYGRSKTVGILFAQEFNRRLRSRGICVTSLHPGGVMTELLRYTSSEMLRAMAEQFAHVGDGKPPPVKTIAQGAATSVWAAFVAPAAEVAGNYCEDCQVARTTETGGESVRPYALDPVRAKALWAKAEDMTMERFPI